MIWHFIRGTIYKSLYINCLYSTLRFNSASQGLLHGYLQAGFRKNHHHDIATKLRITYTL